MRKVALCSAVYKGCEPEVLRGFMSALFTLGRKTDDQVCPFLAQRKRAELASNWCLSNMEQTEETTGEQFTHVLWVDDDVVVDGDAILRLLDCVDIEHPVVAALAFERQPNYRPAIWQGNYFGDQYVSMHQIFDYPADEMIPIVASGLCCVAFDRDVFDAIRKPYFDWVQPGYDRESCTPDGYLFGQFMDHHIPCFCHTGIKVGHMAHPQVVDEAFALEHRDAWRPNA